MELYLQFGYGMMEHCRHLLESWDGGTAILSPRDLSDGQLRKISSTIHDIEGGRVLLDPQFYLPHADHERLCSHDYWPADFESGTFFQGAALRTLLTKLKVLNDALDADAIILPGLLASEIGDAWLETQRAMIEASRETFKGQSVLATIALSADATKNLEQVATLLEAAPGWKADGYYVVCEHPNGDYLVKDPNWIANVLDLAAGLRLAGAQVVLGYCNHQMLAASVSKVNAICSGTWMNVRSFPPDKFRSAYDEEIKQRATWYYCPQALSEYKVPFLDIAQRQGVLQRMAPPEHLDGGYASHLFSGPQPTTVGFTEQAAFRHYLHCLRAQAQAASAATYDETRANHEALLDGAETLLSTLVTAGVRGQQRDFTESLDVNRAALAVLDSTRGPIMRRRWGGIE
ncbi:MAG: hypothetical protein JNJ88_14020 [Planctomycetes bacterium]|nr:hypothetical protein [Planctomycetota bacterium]